MNKKLEALQEYLKELGSVAIAFSSGVDSTFLLKVAHDVLGDQVIAVTAQSCSFPKRELEEAKAFCKKEGIKHIICESEELQIEGFSHNPKNRFCPETEKTPEWISKHMYKGIIWSRSWKRQTRDFRTCPQDSLNCGCVILTKPEQAKTEVWI